MKNRLIFVFLIGYWCLIVSYWYNCLNKKYWDIGWIFIIIKNPILIYIHHLLFLSFRKIIEGKGSRWVILKTFCTQNWTKKKYIFACILCERKLHKRVPIDAWGCIVNNLRGLFILYWYFFTIVVDINIRRDLTLNLSPRGIFGLGVHSSDSH